MRLAGIIGGLLFVASGSAAHAEDAAASTAAYRCWYNAPEHVSCITPGARHRFLHIPLHTLPFDMEGPRRLAQAVMCGTRAGCSIHFSAAPLSVAELDEATDPLLAAAD